MPPQIATHSGPFHADDVMAWALLRTFYAPDATLVRTRDPERIDAADLVVDVGGRYEPAQGRFDHHQAAYTGPFSSAGMVLQWLEEQGRLDAGLAQRLRRGAIAYIDDVDNGRRAPDPEVPCLPRLVELMTQAPSTDEELHAAFLAAGEVAAAWLRGEAAALAAVRDAEALVRAQMEEAEQEGRNVLFFDAYLKWKEPYFAHGGETHPTEYVMFPSTDGTWRIVAIPPQLGAFAQKRSLPAEWAGLTDEALAEVTGIEDSIFCHKNLFIAVFGTRESALQALKQSGRLDRE